jgi:iron complex outermembrane receptor protein
VVLGPASALYGPNASNGIVNIITKDPRTSKGTTLVLGGTGGVRSSNAVSGRFRHAGAYNKLAYKATFEYTEGQDYSFVDSVYFFSGAPFFRPALPEKQVDFDFKHIRGEGSLYYTILDQTDVIVSYGYSRNSYLGITSAGRNQVKDWEYQYLQLRYVSPRLFAQVYNTWTDAGKTFAIATRTAFFDLNTLFGKDSTTADQAAFALANFQDKSWRLNTEIQYNNTFGGFYTVVGFNYQRDNADSKGTYLLDADGAIKLNQYGVSAQIEKELPSNFKAVLAGRFDHHERYGDQFSPKAALLWNGTQGTWRVTYGRAFVAPTILFQDAFIFGGVIVGNGRGLTVVDDTGTRTIKKVEPEIVNTIEVGYKGIPSKNIYLDVNGYFSISKNFISPAIPVGGQVTKIGDDVLDTPLNNPSTYINFGEVNSWGLDLGMNYYLNQYIDLGVKYSYFDSNLDENNKDNDLNGDGQVTPDELSLNSPQHKVVLSANFRNLLNQRLFGSLVVRAVSEYDFYSGRQIASENGEGTRVAPFNFNPGPLGGFTTVDVSLGYKIHPQVILGANVTNLFDVEQREFVGSPTIGRLLSTELRVQF